MNRSFILLSVLSLWCLQSPCLAAMSKDDQQTVVMVDGIVELPDDPDSLSKALMPLMETTAEALKQRPDDYRLHFILARAYDRLGMEDLAANEDRRAESSAESFPLFALEALKKKVMASDFLKAMIYYPFAAKHFPDDASVAIVKAIQFHKKGQLAEEEQTLEHVLNLGRKELGVLTVLASLKADKGQYAEAIKLFDQDLAGSPKYEPALLGKAAALEASGHYRESLGISIPFYLADPYRRKLAALVADSLSQLGSYKDALRPAMVSLAVASTQAEMDEAKHRIRVLWPRVSLKERAAEIAGISHVLDDTVWGARMHFALGDVLQQAGFIREAEYQFRSGLKIQPAHGRAYLHLGEIYQNNYHNKATAILFYLNYLRYSNDPTTKARLMRLGAVLKNRGDIAQRFKNFMIQF